MKNQIEQHAVFCALLCKYAIEYAKDAGRKAILEGIKTVGKERGIRMAARTVANGEELSFVNYAAYTEWTPAPGEMISEITEEDGMIVQKVTKCPWNEAWRKHNLLEYGKYYCIPIDKALYSAFDYEHHCEVPKNLSWGDEECRFEWNEIYQEETVRTIEKKKAAFAGAYIKDFDYHTAHVRYTVGKTIKKRLGEKTGERILSAAADEFVRLFGREYMDALEGKYP